MDGFLDLFWNLDQIRGWAETRNPELVRAATLRAARTALMIAW
jgi:hypothetical protein